MKARAVTRARALRRAANAPEAAAWTALRSLRKEGFPVRRQHPVGRFFVDFAILRARLAIEIDGGVHDWAPVAARDDVREKEIVEAGWRVLRVPAETALSRHHLLELVQNELGMESRGAALTPGPSPRGRGGETHD